MKRSGWLVACALLAALPACSKTPSAPAPAAARVKSNPVAKPALPVDEPLEPPIARVEKPAAPPAEALSPIPEEPLAAPVDTRFGAAASLDGESATGHLWGPGLSGVGRGGGGTGAPIGIGTATAVGRGAGTSSGASFGAGHGSIGGFGAGGSLLPAVRSSPPAMGSSAQMASGVRAGEWDDNANFREFTRWLATERTPGTAKLDLSARRFVVVRDPAGKAVPSCPVEVRSASGEAVHLMTTATGRAILFPRAEGLGDGDLVATARCGDGATKATFRATPGDGVVDLQLKAAPPSRAAQTIDVAFVLDTTGSMSEEISALRDTLEKVAAELSTLNVHPRVGLVEYRDRGDAYVTRMHQMTTDVAGLQARIAGLSAGGGGDTPEHVNEALRVAVRSLKFKPESAARLVFLIGDAPPHLDYAQDEGYAGAVKEANHAGVQIFTIAASGMDRVGQVVWRQIAQYTGGTNLFVLRGGAGPESTGGGDPRSSCGGTHTDYTSDNLDALILGKVRGALAARNADPMRIAGLNRDEKDLPCDQRVVAMQ